MVDWDSKRGLCDYSAAFFHLCCHCYKRACSKNPITAIALGIAEWFHGGVSEMNRCATFTNIDGRIIRFPFTGILFRLSKFFENVVDETMMGEKSRVVG
uniref:Uncharacterized protein n=1 Tax=Romanomermis culicivorax TaxID=13658 RepID=A0A915KNR3_ROMCU